MGSLDKNEVELLREAHDKYHNNGGKKSCQILSEKQRNDTK